MIPEAADLLNRESERVYVVYDGKTGEIAHIHRVWTCRGGTAMTPVQEEAAGGDASGEAPDQASQAKALAGPRHARSLRWSATTRPPLTTRSRARTLSMSSRGLSRTAIRSASLPASIVPTS